MALRFNGANSQSLDLGSALVTAAPFAFVARFRPLSVGTAMSVVSAANSGSTSHYFSMEVSVGANLRVRVNDGSSGDSVNTVSMNPSKAPFLGIAHYMASGTIVNYHNNFRASSNNLKTPTGINTFSIGRKASSGTLQYYTGDVDWVAVYDTTNGFSDAAAMALWHGEDPRRVLPQGLIAFWPLTDEGPIQYDRVKGYHLTASSSPPVLVEGFSNLRKPRRRIFVLGGAVQAGGTTYNDTVSESVTAAESDSAVATFNPATSDALPAAESLDVVATLNPTASEGLTGSDTLEAANSLPVSTSDAMTVADSIAEVATFNAPLSEPVTGADSLTAVGTFNPAASESLEAGESISPSVTFDAAILESLTVAESLAVLADLAVTLVESLAGSDSLSAAATLAATLSDALTAAATDAMAATFNDTHTASVTASDSMDDGGAQTYNETVLEALVAAEALAALATFAASVEPD